VVFSFAFSGLWFRSLYGSVPRAVVRCAIYAAGIGSCLLLWPLVHPGVPAPAAAPLLGTFPVMFLVVVVGRMLGANLFAREQAAQRDAALVAAGSRVLSTTDRGEVLAAAGAGCVEIAAATPGLRLVAVTCSDDRLVVDGTAGELVAEPTALPATVLGAGPDGAVVVADATALDAAVGRRCAWVCVALPDSDERAWMLFGAPRAVPEEAVLAVRALMNQVTLALRNSQAHAELTTAARTDALTGLPNRSAFHGALAASASADGGVVLFIDLDGFKAVNDRLGHRAGDALLREVAVRLRTSSRAGDTCARLGGDEFAVLLPATTPADAEAVAERLRQAVGAPVRLDDEGVRVGASIGLAAALPGSDADHVLQCADTAMYADKDARRAQEDARRTEEDARRPGDEAGAEHALPRQHRAADPALVPVAGAGA